MCVDKLIFQIELKQKLEKSPKLSYYGSRFFYKMDSNLPVGLCLSILFKRL